METTSVSVVVVLVSTTIFDAMSKGGNTYERVYKSIVKATGHTSRIIIGRGLKIEYGSIRKGLLDRRLVELFIGSNSFVSDDVFSYRVKDFYISQICGKKCAVRRYRPGISDKQYLRYKKLRPCDKSPSTTLPPLPPIREVFADLFGKLSW